VTFLKEPQKIKVNNKEQEKKKKLEQNSNSTSLILKYAYAIISHSITMDIMIPKEGIRHRKETK
jgi:hypothetical protein